MKMKLIKITIFALYTLIVVCIGIATVVEKYRGTTFVGDNIYGAWWFSALWAVLTVFACAYMMKQKLYKRFAVMLLHLSFVVILAGAMTTHLFARRGTMRLRTGVPEISYIDKERKVHHLPFSLTLNEFRVVNYPGTDAPLDYQSVVQVGTSHSDPKGATIVLTMGAIVSPSGDGSGAGYHFFQKSYDSDGQGVTLGLSYDPYGIGITYTGYLMLLVGILATLLSRKTQMRELYRKAVAIPLLLFSVTVGVNAGETSALPSVDADIAHRMGTINVLYNNRICPLNTVATDFVMKMTGSATWKGYSADEVFFSWMIYYMPWESEYKKHEDARGRRKTEEERRAVVEMFYNGQFTKIFPFPLSSPEGDTDASMQNNEAPAEATVAPFVKWFSPGAQVLPREIPVKEQFFIKQSMDFLTESIVTGQRDRAFEIIAKIKLFQRDMIGDLLPSETTTHTEIFYNTLRSQKWPVFLALTLSLLLCVAMLFLRKPSYIIRFSLITLHVSLFIYVTLQLGLRWVLSDHVPVSNGPETMLFMAWVLLLLTIMIRKHFPIILAFGPLIASFCLLVAMLGGSSSQLTPLMPVLQSPLLSVHVMTVMCAYALFALQTMLGVQAFFLIRQKKASELEQNTALSRLLLYPAVFLLTIGIFLGAVWANVSWGTYWSWDPKEAWALITLMVYAVPLHTVSIQRLRDPVNYHIYMAAAFTTVVITYFGVNYFLGGMHSYA